MVSNNLYELLLFFSINLFFESQFSILLYSQMSDPSFFFFSATFDINRYALELI